MPAFLTDIHLSSLLKASWQAAVLILLVLAVQWALGRRLTPRGRYALWLHQAFARRLPRYGSPGRLAGVTSRRSSTTARVGPTSPTLRARRKRPR